MSTISVDYDVLNQRGSPAWFTDTFANIPTAGYVGRMFISKDTFAFYRDTGTGWDLIGGPGIGTLTGSGVVGQVSFFNGTQVLAGNNNLFWDNTNSRLGINTTTPGQPLDIHSTGNTLVQLNNTTTANSNISFQNQNVAKWRVGNVYNAGANSFNIENAGLLTNALTISSTTNNITLTGALGGTSSTFSGNVNGGTFYSQAGIFLSTSGQATSGGGFATINGGNTYLDFRPNNGGIFLLSFPYNTTRTFTLPNADGTIALTSDLSSYLPLTGGTLTGALVINPTNTLTIGLDVASNTTRFRSDNLEGFKRQLEIVMGSGTLVQLTAKGYLANYGTDLAFYTSTSGGVNASPGIYITGTNNRVGIGNGTPSSTLDVTGSGAFSTTLTALSKISIGSTSTLSGIDLWVHSNSTNNVNTARISLTTDATGHTTADGSWIHVESTSLNITNYENDLIAFSTNATERMRISAAGLLLVNRTTTGGENARMQLNSTAQDGILVTQTSSSGYCFKGVAVSNGGTFYFNLFSTTTTDVGSITSNGTTTSYNVTSDYRLKENVLPINNAIDKILKIKPVIYKWKNTDNLYGEGFIAHELQEIIPLAVTGEKDAIDENGKVKLQQVDYSKLVPTLVKAIQELNEKLVRNNIN